MGTWNSRGLRGSALEDLINLSNEKYLSAGLALVQKIPTPIKPIRIDKESRQITLAYFDQRSTVDYMGIVQGIPICFDAKETASDTYSINNIHDHQVRFMENFELQKGIAFIILQFTKRDETYYIPYRDIKKFWERAEGGGRKSFCYDEIDKDFVIPSSGGLLVHYLETLQKDLLSR
ncbi:MAG: Holliday junction resolvase RecU [Clostridiales bacterium]|nr:Holliday junction resolvase RecU [Clostridiales bacterium]MDU1041839.1 Holliday junction resolvase RecU [Clostridiales bacterium]MDU3489464.1 Holliday junction resolvase RecU [Clostridiales bacterium]